ncbi:MAG TPA: hypothetical protein VLL54_01115 [Pyrinomonadaceae bacterium]|nr:hypothetical protein [Pyrinomonadaceae bacterium]
MKLCPKCDFIYEDDQSFCDMDGRELVLRLASEPTRTRVTIPLGATEASAEQRSSGVVVAAVVLFLLTTLVVVVYFARSRQTNAQRSPQRPQTSIQTPTTQTSAQSPTEQPAATEEVADAHSKDSADPALSSSDEVQSEVAKQSLAHSRLNAGPVSAGASAGNRGSVIVHLNNGAAIKADEAWEKREGVWYRQEGMVTFLKRSSVRSIERVGTSAGAEGAPGTTPAAKKSATRDQLRIAKLEPVNAKKPNRVTSFFKKTGSLIKKPFKF